MNKIDLKIKTANVKYRANEMFKKCNIFNPADVEQTIFNIINEYNNFLTQLLEEHKKPAASLVRVFFIDSNGRWGSPVYYVKCNGDYFRLIYRDEITMLDDLNCLDRMRLRTYDVRKSTGEVLEYYGVISIYE